MRRVGSWVVFSAVLLLGCNGQEEYAVSPQETNIDWAQLENTKVVFGHQSVGGNILDGVRLLAQRDGAQVDIVEQRSSPSSSGFSHFMVGRNEDPLSKISDFVATVDAGAIDGADVALMKFCYVDFSAETDVQEIAQSYISNLDALAQRHPDTVFVAVTTPLRSVQTGPKAWIKKLLGREPAQYVENSVRADFNQLIRDHYSGDGRLFDLAKVEAEATGKRTTVNVNGREVETLARELTSDGGHLNEQGQILVATELLKFINDVGPQN